MPCALPVLAASILLQMGAAEQVHRAERKASPPPRSAAATAAASAATPNILFVIIDDAGIDLFERWNPAGIELPQTPVIDSLCDQGVRFSNVWSP